MKFLETYWPFLLGVILSYVFYKFLGQELDLIELNFLQTNVTVSTVIFGFLLTMLSIIAQTSNRATETLKKFDRYNDVIKLNKFPVGFSSINAIISIIYIVIIKKDTFSESEKLILETVLFFFASSMVFTTYNFVRLFYMIITK